MKKALSLSPIWQALIYVCCFLLGSYSIVGSYAAAAVNCKPDQNSALGLSPSLTGPDTPGALLYWLQAAISHDHEPSLWHILVMTCF